MNNEYQFVVQEKRKERDYWVDSFAFKNIDEARNMRDEINKEEGWESRIIKRFMVEEVL